MDSAPVQISFGKLLVFAPDMQIAEAFYGGTLQLERLDGGDDFAIYQGSNFELLLFKCEEPTSADGYARRAGSTACFAVSDILESMTYLKEKGVEVLHAEPQPGPGLSYVAFADPFGTVHELVEYAS